MVDVRNLKEAIENIRDDGSVERIVDLERQIAELRAQRDRLVEKGLDLILERDLEKAENVRMQSRIEAAEAENARLRAPPLKDEVERVVERCTNLLDAAGRAIEEDGWDMDFTHVDGISTDHIGFSTDCENAVSNARALLSRLRAGEQEGDGSRGSPEYYAEKRAREWAVERWNAEVKNRPLVNVHRAGLDTAWRQVIRHFGGDPEMLVGPDHYMLVEQTAAPSEQGGDRG